MQTRYDKGRVKGECIIDEWSVDKLEKHYW